MFKRFILIAALLLMVLITITCTQSTKSEQPQETTKSEQPQKTTKKSQPPPVIKKTQPQMTTKKSQPPPAIKKTQPPETTKKSQPPQNNQNIMVLSKGSIEVIQDKKSTFYDQVGSKITLLPNQKIKTGANSRLIIDIKGSQDKVELFSKTTLFLPPKAKIDTTRMFYFPKGKIRFTFKKSKKANKPRSIRIRTSTALIGVKGTDSVVNTNKKTSNLFTVEGVVSLANANQPNQEIIVTANQISKVDKGYLPTKPITISPEKIEKILSEDSGDSFKKIKYGKSLGVTFPKPSGFTVKLVKNSATLSWKRLANAISYVVYWNTTPKNLKKKGKKIITKTNTYIHKELKENISYYYAVSAKYKAGESKITAVKSVKLIKKHPPETPKNLTLKIQDQGIALSWEKAIDAEEYIIYWSNNQNELVKTGNQIKVDTTQYFHSLEKDDKTYFYTVRSSNKDGESKASEIKSIFLEKPPIPAIPLKFETEAGNGAVLLQWDKADNATGYSIYWSTEEKGLDSVGVKIISLEKNQYFHDDLDNGTTYYYAISGVNPHNEGERTQVQKATPQIWLSFLKFLKNLGADETEEE